MLDGRTKGSNKKSILLAVALQHKLSLLEITEYGALNRAQWRKLVHVAYNIPQLIRTY